MVEFRNELRYLRDKGYQPMHNGRPSCPFCERFVDDESTHSPLCSLVKYLNRRAYGEIPDGRLNELIEFLYQYGDHKGDCRVHNYNIIEPSCDCGWSDIWKKFNFDHHPIKLSVLR